LPSLGHYPTPVEFLEPFSHAGSSLWIKRDDLTHPIYGGNKVRKLERILVRARDNGATTLLTLGAIGSHHVLATTVHGRHAGFQVEAVLVPQPRTPHVVETLEASLAAGLVAHSVSSWARVPAAIARRLGPHTAFVTVGGSNVDGALGYHDAAFELAEQVRQGQVPEPDLVVVALGSAGTAGGLVAGLASCGLRSRVVGVAIADPPILLRAIALRLARGCVDLPRRALAERLLVETGFRGPGYGFPTARGEEALQRASFCGLLLDPTYTAKAFAAALDLVDRRAARTVLYWHTLSSAPMAPLLVGAPDLE
jgi:1-aminocyclopropane-1-carboxylate deaminase/D-cysteine desulfhydrase-like pyridoxal-dependent ACC family enzyme